MTIAVGHSSTMAGAKLTSAPVVFAPVKAIIPRTEIQQIIADIATKHGLSYADIMRKGRLPHVVAARHEAIGAVFEARPNMSLALVGRLFRRDRTTIRHALVKRGLL